MTFWGWRAGFWSAGAFCVLVALWVYWFLQGRPQSLGLPSVAEWKSDYWDAGNGQRTEFSTWRTQLTIFGIPAIWTLALASALMYVTRYAINSWGILYLQEEHGYSLLDAGLFLCHLLWSHGQVDAGDCLCRVWGRIERASCVVGRVIRRGYRTRLRIPRHSGR